MAERVDLAEVQAICEPSALVPGFDGTGVRVLMDAHSQAVVVRLRDLQRLLTAMVTELRVACEELRFAREVVGAARPWHRGGQHDPCDTCQAIAAYDQHADPSTHDRSGSG